jgi:site-specific DNA recombinase
MWVGPVPLGYDQYSKDKEQFIAINEKCKLLRQAFHWKAEEELTAVEIADRLKKLGFKVTAKRLSEIFRNPFYCGLISHSTLDGQLVEGKHPPIVSKDLFLKVNDVLTQNPQGYKQEKEKEALPLKRFLKCAECGTNYTGYYRKNKNIYYYKCNKTGCKCNRNANALHESWKSLLAEYTIDPNILETIEVRIREYFLEIDKAGQKNENDLKVKLEEINRKIELIQERFALDEISKELYDRFLPKYIEERKELSLQFQNTNLKLSNHLKMLPSTLIKCSKLTTLWDKKCFSKKQKMQFSLFKEGLEYDRKNDNYRTPKINLFLELTRSISSIIKKKNGDKSKFQFTLSPSVAGARLELTTFGL